MNFLKTTLQADSFGGLTFGGAGELHTGLGTVDGIMIFIINLVFNVGISLSLFFVIVGGIKIVTSSGDEGKFNEGRDTVMWSVIGCVVIIGFRSILYIIFNLIS
jgi:hypothetical protein